MTIDDQVGQPLKVLSCNDNQQQQQQQQQTPFHIVLVDINKAASGRIHCVKLPLEDSLNYIALSYRWGELQEKMVDTDVDYTATVTSFRLEDFCQICRLMSMESDLRDIRYVWVDAMCVDQNNYERRKATIHQMTNIYEHAKHILAVPDLHLQYLKNTNTINRDTIHRAAPFRKDIYYLLHRKIDSLMALEQERLDFYGVPKDPALRHLLTKYTDYFTEGLTTFREHSYDYNPEEILDHIYESSRAAEAAAALSLCATTTHNSSDKTTSNHHFLTEIQHLHHCNQVTCPFIYFVQRKRKHHGQQKQKQPTSPPLGLDRQQRSGRNREWKQQIYDRSVIIRSSIDLLTDLIVDCRRVLGCSANSTLPKRKTTSNIGLFNSCQGLSKISTRRSVMAMATKDSIFLDSISTTIARMRRFNVSSSKHAFQKPPRPILCT